MKELRLGPEKRSLYTYLFQASIIKIVGSFLLFAMHVVLARNLGAHDYGILSYGMALASLLTIVASVGLPNTTMRYIAEYHLKTQWASLRGIVIRGFQLTFIASFLISLLTLCVSLLFRKDIQIRYALGISSLVLPMITLSQWLSKANRGLKRVAESMIPEEIIIPLCVICTCLLIRLSLRNTTYLYVGSILVANAASALWLLRYMPDESKKALSAYDTRLWVGVSLPIIVGSLMQTALGRIDILMLGAVTGMHATGVYSTAARVSLLTTFFLTVCDRVIAPMIASAYFSNNFSQLRNLYFKALCWIAVGTLPICAVIMLKTGFFLQLFGSAFDEAIIPLRILTVGQLVNALTGPASFTLLMTGHEKIFSYIFAAGALISLVGNAVLIPHLQAVGAALATSSCTVVVNILMLVAAYRLVLSRIDVQ